MGEGGGVGLAAWRVLGADEHAHKLLHAGEAQHLTHDAARGARDDADGMRSGQAPQQVDRRVDAHVTLALERLEGRAHLSLEVGRVGERVGIVAEHLVADIAPRPAVDER